LTTCDFTRYERGGAPRVVFTTDLSRLQRRLLRLLGMKNVYND
jgi:hypothetical protein